MIKKKITALVLAAALPFSVYGCSTEKWIVQEKSESSTSEASEDSDSDDRFVSVELDTVKEHINEMLENSEISGNSKKLEKNIDTLLSDYDHISEELTYLTIDYYKNWDDEKAEEKYDQCYEKYYVAGALLRYGFTNCYAVDEYAELFAPYAVPEDVDYYTNRAMSMERIEGYTRVDYNISDSYLDEYYDIVNDTKTEDNEKNIAAAELYLDILSTYNADTLYDYYDRDYSPEDIFALSGVIRSELTSVTENIMDILSEMPEYEELYNAPDRRSNVFELISWYASDISYDIGIAAEELYDNKNYTIGKGDNSYNVPLTIGLPVKNSAIIYTYNYGDCLDFSDAVHEFGHYYALCQDDTPAFLEYNNIDIAEIQSQGMEALFMEQFDSIFSNKADAMRLTKLYDMLNAVLSGFTIGEFEYNVLKNIDTMTPDDVIDYYNSLTENYDTEAPFYSFSHIFEQPGYYISYGVSALAALNIWETSLDDYGKAVEMYENIASISCNSGEYQFRTALSESGFSDVLSEDYIKQLNTKLAGFIEQ